MTQTEKARALASLHVKGRPVVLYNVWDAGSAKAVAAAGAQAIATGSWSVAAAHGYADGEAIPLDFVVQIARRIAASVDIPVTIDFEGGYAGDPDQAARNVVRIIEAGAIGVNFEDQVVGGEGLYEVAEQSRRIAAVRRAADATGVPLFINARTDLFLKEKDAARHRELMAPAIERAAAYRDAGGNGFFVPGLVDETLIGEICSAVELPVNIMMKPGAPSVARLAELGVARVSHGPFPFIALMETLTEKAREALG